jgi:hypothetical protein
VGLKQALPGRAGGESEMDRIERIDDSDWSSIVLTAVVVVLLAELPAFCVYDVISHDRMTIGLDRQTSWLIELIHSAYTLTAGFALLQLGRQLWGVVFPEGDPPAGGRSTKKPVMSAALRTTLLVAYALPLFWLLNAVPGYWGVVYNTWMDW